MLPQGQPATSVEDSMRLEYDIETLQSGNLSVTLHLSPTLDTVDSDGLRSGVSLNGKPVQIAVANLIPTSGALHVPELQAWINAVIKNGHSVTMSLGKVASGKQTVHIWRVDENIVLEKITWQVQGGGD